MNGTSEVKHLSIAFEGVKSVKPMATLVTLSGKSPGATNTITHPDAIVPREHPIQVAVSHFAHSFEPYSVNVVELSLLKRALRGIPEDRFLATKESNWANTRLHVLSTGILSRDRHSGRNQRQKPGSAFHRRLPLNSKKRRRAQAIPNW